ncbi:hypothetical protein DCAR_0102716 [Daucus carota subsp. sativus]|uniref:Uncharacterized protein n=1 Tax=Daucus carota subsp. sativus TaxID=79200 RepID=A0A166H8J3_DAUCS|nr:hypothetical protein DCAR_0102716 [Daucus carota subsp. sativus]
MGVYEGGVVKMVVASPARRKGMGRWPSAQRRIQGYSFPNEQVMTIQEHLVSVESRSIHIHFSHKFNIYNNFYIL